MGWESVVEKTKRRVTFRQPWDNLQQGDPGHTLSAPLRCYLSALL